MGGEGDVNAVIDVKPFGMVGHFFSEKGYAAHKGPSFVEVFEFEAFCNRIAALNTLPVFKLIKVLRECLWIKFFNFIARHCPYSFFIVDSILKNHFACVEPAFVFVAGVGEGVKIRKGKPMGAKQIIMNFSVPPSVDDLEVMAATILEALPEELMEFCEGAAVVLEEFPDDTVERDLELEDPYELLALYRSGKEISPGVEKKTANDEDVLILYRRPILDMWCDSGEDLATILRQVIIEELGKNFDFSDGEIEEMAQRHYQGML